MLFGFLGVKLMIAHDSRATSAIVGVKLLLTMIVHLALFIVLAPSVDVQCIERVMPPTF